MSLILLLLLACGGPPPDPELVALGRAVGAAERGEAAFAAHDLPAARSAFAEALAARPDDALLHAWAGRVEAEAGDDVAALAALDRALEGASGLGPARLLRARVHARAGRLDAAAADVLAALRGGAIRPREVLRDRELAAVAASPALAALPDAPLEARLSAPDATAFLGSEVEVTLDVVGVLPGPVVVEGPGTGPVVVVRAEEDEREGEGGDRVRTLRWTLRVVGAGDVAVGPLRVAQPPDAVTATTAAVGFRAEAPPGRFEAAPPLRLPTPGGVLGARVAPAAWRDGDVTWVAAPPGGRVEVDGPIDDRPWRLARDGAPIADLVRLSGPVERVRVRRQDGAVVLDVVPE